MTGRRLGRREDIRNDYCIHRYRHGKTSAKARRTDKAIARREDRARQKRILEQEAKI